MAMRWSMWVATMPPPRARRRVPCTIRSSPSISTVDAVGAQAVGDGGEAVGFLHPQLLEAAHAGRALARTPPAPPGSDIRRSSRARAPPARRRRAAPSAHAEVGHLLAAIAAQRSSVSISAPISRSVVMRPVRSGLVITSVRTTSEPGTISAATIGNAADDGSAGTTTGAGRQLGLARAA